MTTLVTHKQSKLIACGSMFGYFYRKRLTDVWPVKSWCWKIHQNITITMRCDSVRGQYKFASKINILDMEYLVCRVYSLTFLIESMESSSSARCRRYGCYQGWQRSGLSAVRSGPKLKNQHSDRCSTKKSYGISDQ